VDRTAIPQLHHNCTIDQGWTEKASLELHETAGRRPNPAAPPRGLEPLTRRLEVVGRGSTEVWSSLYTGLDQGVSIRPVPLGPGGTETTIETTKGRHKDQRWSGSRVAKKRRK
jgi:hypothetical protein